MAETTRAGPESLMDVMRGWGQLKANDSGWPTFDGRYASYPRFKREWKAYRETYHSAVNNDLASKALRDKCIKGDALRMVDDLQEILSRQGGFPSKLRGIDKGVKRNQQGEVKEQGHCATHFVDLYMCI